MTRHETLTFDQVEKDHHESTYEEVAGFYRGPMSKHPVISVKGHPEVIWVRPDMGVGAVANSFSFAVGSPAQEIPWREVTRSLKLGYLPIVISKWQSGPLLFTQTSFATLLGASEVKTGHEKQLAMVQMNVTNTEKSPTSADLWAFVPGSILAKGVPPFPYNTYDLFEIAGQRPPIRGYPSEPKDNLLRDGVRIVGIYSVDSSVRTQVYDHVLHFPLQLKPNETKSLRLMVTSSARGLTADETSILQKMDFSSALDQRIRNLEATLAVGTQITVPDDVVNNIFRAQILHYQTQILQAADKDYCLPVQGFQGVWPWEAMKLTTHLDSIGHHEDVRKCLEYFLKIQGRFPPHGNFKSSDAVFGGTIAFEESGWERDPESTFYGQLARSNAGKEGEFPNWMNGTGAMLHAFATHYRYTRDSEWLNRVAPALVRACDWIISERQETKKADAHGEKVLHFGLLPIGRAYDTAEEAIRQLASDGELAGGKMDDRHAPLDTYYPCFTDSYSSQGLSGIAEALEEIAHPDSARLLEEAKAYRDDILEVMRRTRATDPNGPPYPERLNRPPAWAEFATGALSYLDSGFLPSGAEAFTQLEEYMKVKWNRGVLGLTGGMEKNGDPHGSHSFYVNFSEDIWHRGWLLRGETEKALLAFYSMLAYGVDKQTFATVERFHLTDDRYAPFFMDTSANARVCGLIRQALILEEGKMLYLLLGVPRRWLEDGKQIDVAKGITTAAKVDLKVKSHLREGKILIDFTLADLQAEKLEGLRLRIPHPVRQQMKKVLVNGQPWTRFNSENEIIELTPGNGRTEIVVSY
ncbi:MAG TPA: hypothetical protein VH079_02020 [Terriglobales bacterium]|nr:hypothetical protein [Terriglobales bacterium]